jgi:hypothetical protein
MPSSTPLIIQFKGISEADAERLLAMTWCILERHAFVSPLVAVRSEKASIDITLTFEFVGDRTVVERELSCMHLALCFTGGWK